MPVQTLSGPSGRELGKVAYVLAGGRAPDPPTVSPVQRHKTAHPAADPAGAVREERGLQAQAAGAHDEDDEQQQTW